MCLRGVIDKALDIYYLTINLGVVFVGLLTLIVVLYDRNRSLRLHGAALLRPEAAL